MSMASITLNPLFFYVLYAFGLGVAKGLIYPAALAAGYSHLPGRKGLVSGIVTSGVGFGAFVFGIVANRLVNPNNVEIDDSTGYFPPEVNNNVPKMLRTIALVWTI